MPSSLHGDRRTGSHHGDGALPRPLVAAEKRAAFASCLARSCVYTDPLTEAHAYGTWLAQAGCRHTYAADLELYGAAYRPNSADSVLHYAIPIAGPGAIS